MSNIRGNFKGKATKICQCGNQTRYSDGVCEDCRLFESIDNDDKEEEYREE